jgi:Zn finger protein HypA/HybF involved in hydrogenase expression
MEIHRVLWRCLEGKTLPLSVQLGARCRICGASIDVGFRLVSLASKPERLRCPLCRAHDVHLMSARATTVEG